MRQRFANANMALQYTHDATFTNDFVAGWVTINIPVWGPATLGFKLDLNGNPSWISDVDQLGPRVTRSGSLGELSNRHDLVTEQTFEVASGTQ